MGSYIKTEVGNGETETSTKLSEMIDNGEWKWPMMWTRRYPILNSIHVPKLENCQDKTVLENNEGVEIKFSISAM
ncbi:hypothetical protein Tco_0334241 [Tanacetum coccineum]